ncbi:DoxX family protein [Acidocella sp.]|uniref:DoxX family protein n=1 Tax=Acidocella sp. TaxID=50710 RepID=UPI002611228A|nr:DoxX family protein [Acidocella sp.]
MNFITHVLPDLIARVLLVCMFLPSAWDKVAHWGEAMQQASSAPVPCPACLLILGMLVEAVTAICIIIGWHDRLAAFILAGFCVVTAILYHPYWKFPGYWRNPGEGRQHFWDFYKNLGLAGGLGLLVISGGPAPLGYVLAHPFSSAPYAAASQP